MDCSLDDGCLALRWQSSCPRIDLSTMVEDWFCPEDGKNSKKNNFLFQQVFNYTRFNAILPFAFPSFQVTLFCSILMITPTLLFLPGWLLWVIGRNMYFMFRWPVGVMYLGQSPDKQKLPSARWIKATLVDIMSKRLQMLKASQVSIVKPQTLISPNYILVYPIR